jgi:ubiquitin-protein ligase
MSPRIRRLIQDQERLKRRFGDSEIIRITGTAGMPPEAYRFSFNIRGVYADGLGQILPRSEHVMEVNLSLGYPRRAPQCRMLTPIFHPNFDAASVCTGDFWAASESLDELIIRVGRMIAYQEYNTKSPLNGLAARWASENPRFLPIDSREIAPSMQSKFAGNGLEGTIKQTIVEEPIPIGITETDDGWPEKIVIG